MKFKNSHKAFAITFLITASIMLLVVNSNVVNYNKKIAETFIDIDPEFIKEDIETEENIKETQQKTNKAYNETKKHKHFAQAFKPIAPPEDYKNPRLLNKSVTEFEIKKASENTNNSNVNTNELTAFESVNSILKKRTNASSQSTDDTSVNKNSSIRYSLKDRTDTFLPVPIYLCEANGEIVVNITVNNKGKVTSTAINNASSSHDECLKARAIEFAKKARFNTSTKPSQIGTITFSFKGKNSS